MRPVWSGEEAPRGQGLLESERDGLGPPRNPRHVDVASVSHHGSVVRAEVTAYSIHRP